MVFSPLECLPQASLKMADPHLLEMTILKIVADFGADKWVPLNLGGLRARLGEAHTRLASTSDAETVSCICALEGEDLLGVRTYDDGKYVPFDRERWKDEHYVTQFFYISSFELKATHYARRRLVEWQSKSAESPSAHSLKSSKFSKPKEIVGPFDVYTVGATIRRGTSGVVYSVENSDNERFALKVLTRKDQSRALSRFKNEINFSSIERSKHIIRVLEYGRTADGFLFYVMPYYSSTLRDLIDARTNHADVLPLFAQMLDGVEAAHLLGVFHRDIKPENILFDSTTKLIVIADFGISRFKEDDLLEAVDTAPNEKLANFAYAAPEQRVREKKVDHRADIYSLGLILNEMFTGDVPFGTDFRKIRDVAPDFGYLDDLVDSMIRQRPEERPQSIASVKEALIARKHAFVEVQRLDALKTKVIPVSEVNDPLIADPIRAVEKLDFEGGVLTLRLNQSVNQKWENCFRNRATSYSSTASAARIAFRGDRVMLQTDPHFMQQMINYFKQYAEVANEEYATVVRAEHAFELQQQRSRLASELAAREAKAKLLQNITL
jgi:serine/threonine protein kinase